MKNNGRVESAHGILEQRVQEPLAGPSWANWLTANYEEDVGLDAEGRFGKRGEAVFLAIQGGGIMLSSPQRLHDAYTNRTPEGEPSLRQEEISQALAGTLPNGQQIKVYTPEQLLKESVGNLPQTYATVTPLKYLEGIESGAVDVNKLPKNRIFVMRAGHQTTAKDYAKTLSDAGVRKYGNRHSLSSVVADNPSGRVPLVYDIRNGGGGLSSSSGSLFYSACFVGVRQAVGAEGAAPQLGLEGTVQLLRGLVDPARIPQLMETLRNAGYR